MSHALGSMLILLSAIGFGAMALCANLAYADGVDTASLLALRFVIGSATLGILTHVQGGIWPSAGSSKRYLLMGCIYAAMAGAYFTALRHAASSVVALILYTYPMLVAVMAAFLRLDRFGMPQMLALSGSSIGLMIMLGTSLEGSLTGVLLAFLSAVCYAGYIILGGSARDEKASLAAACLVLCSAGMIFAFFAMYQGFHLPTTPKSWLAVGFLAIFSSSIAIAAFVAGLNRVGPTQAAVLSTLEPVVTIGLGVAFLNESLHTSTVIGGLVIVFSALGLTLAQSRHISVASLTTFIFTAFGVKK